MKQRDRKKYYAGQAEAIYELQMREAVIRLTREGVSEKEIARQLGQTPAVIKRYRKESLHNSAKRAAYYLYQPEDAEADARALALPIPLVQPALRKARRPAHPRKGAGPGPHIMSDPLAYAKARARRAYWPGSEDDAATSPPRRQHALSAPGGNQDDDDEAGSRAGTGPYQSSSSSGSTHYTANPIFEGTKPPPPPPRPPGVSGEILPAPDVLQHRADALRLRKAMVPFDKIAEVLGITEQDARQYCADAINEIQRSERLNSDMERQLMIEQLDQMIAAIHTPATGQNLRGDAVPVVFEAIDRMMKLMKQKAELLGLSAPPAIDIRIKLQSLAEEGSYDILDVEDVARDVLQAHKLRLPEFR